MIKDFEMIPINTTYAIRLLGSAVIVSSIAITSTSAETMPSQAEMWKMIQTQQKQIEDLTKKLKLNEEKTDSVIDVVETQQQGGGTSGGSTGWWQNTQIGGYGELHYNGGDKDQIDFHRFVAMINHQFNDSLRFFSEIELEHSLSGDDQPGEVELEQAYIEYDINENLRAKGGLFLLPVGLLNENHEPTRFFGVERNPVESNIIPTTWWEAGAGLSGTFAETFRYDLALHSGLETPTSEGNAFKIRNGRQKVAEATAKDGAVTGRLRWNGINGVDLGVSGQYQNDVTQSSLDEEVDATLLAAHADIRKGDFGLKALYAHWDLGGDAPKLLGRDEQEGWYVEPAYYFGTSIGEFGIFGRYNAYDNEAGNSDDSEYEQIDVGLNYWPHEDVVLKVDMAFVEPPNGQEDDEILNLGIGFTY